MAIMSALDSTIFATDRLIESEVFINGELIPSGLDEEGNVTAISIDFDIEQMPPTAALSMVTIPIWVEMGQRVEINAGYDGELLRVFTGRVKRRRHGPRGDTIDCVGRTAKLTRPYRVVPKSFLSIGARDAIIDILDDDGVDFTVAHNEQFDIDAAINDWTIATVQAAYMETMTPSDMIRKIAAVDGNRIYESRAGTLRIRTLLEAPAPDPFRNYGTAGSDTSADTTILYDDTNIDTAAVLGDAAAREWRGQGFTPAVDGTILTVAFWCRVFGSPTDSLRFWIRADAEAGGVSTGLPSATVLGGSALFNGQLLDGSYQKVVVSILTPTPLVSGTLYHLVVERSGANDGANYYEIGLDLSAPAYAGGVSSVFDSGGGGWSSTVGDHAFEVVTRALAVLRLLDIGDDEDEDQVKKKVIVRGATLTSTDVEGNETQTQIEEEAITLSDDLAVGNPDFYAMAYQNDLIQTSLKAAETALRLLDKFHRILQNIEIQVPFDPRMDLGTTIGIDDPRVTGLGGNWWVRGYSHQLAAGQASTQISLFGGDQSGTSGLLLPRPDFNWIAERELIGNALMVVLTLDGGASTDSDGQIVNYRWTDDYAGGAMDVSGPDLVKHTVAYDPSVDSEVNITLEVTDDSGLTNLVTIPVRMGTDNSDIYAPVVSCAAGNTCMATFDGGLSWGDIATPSGSAVVTTVTYDPADNDAPMTILFGTDNGRIYRSVDAMTSLQLVYTDPDGDVMTAITKDLHRRPIIWAATTDRVLLSRDYGATWVVHTDFNDPAQHPLRPPFADGIRVDPRPVNVLFVASPPFGDDIFLAGGVGNVPSSWFQTHHNPLGGSGNWRSGILSGDGPGAAPRTATETVVDDVSSNRTSGDLGLVFSDSAGTPANPYIYTRNFRPTGEADWQIGGGAMVGANLDGLGAARNNNQLQQFGALLDTKTFYVSNDGRRFWPIVNVLPGTAGNRPRGRLVNVSAWKDVYLAPMTEGIAKSIDYGKTWDFFRPVAAPISTTWPGGAIAFEIDIEYRLPRAFAILASVYDTVGGTTSTLARSGTGAWVEQSQDATAYPVVQIYHFPGLGDVIFRTRSLGSTYTGSWQTLQRSPDLGVTWNNTSVLNCADITRASNGDLYAVAGGADVDAHRIYRSTDDGVNWTEVHNDTTISATYTKYRRIEADPHNPNRVVCVGWPEAAGNTQVLLITLDATLGAGATYTRIAGPTGLTDRAEKSDMTLVICTTGRILFGYEDWTGTQTFVDFSDNDGLNFAASITLGAAGNLPPHVMFRAAFDVYILRSSANGVTRTRDNGASWKTFNDMPIVTAQAALTWDANLDILYGGQNDTPEDNTVSMMVSPTRTNIWLDVSDGIAAATGIANNRICQGGLEAMKQA